MSELKDLTGSLTHESSLQDTNRFSWDISYILYFSINLILLGLWKVYILKLFQILQTSMFYEYLVNK